MVKEIWKITKGGCKDNILSKKRLLETDAGPAAKGKTFGDFLGKERGPYSKTILSRTQFNQLIKKMPTIPGNITGISIPNNGNKSYINNGINTDNNGVPPTKTMRSESINIDDSKYSCYSPIKWEEYNTKCNGNLISSTIINSKTRGMYFNKTDNKCRMKCLNNKNCQSYELTKNNCKLFTGTIQSKSPSVNNGGNTYCIVKPYIYNYDSIDKKYNTELQDANTQLKQINNDLEDDTIRMASIYNEYSRGADLYNKKRVIKNKDDFEKTKRIKEKYFDTLINFHKEDIDTITRDNATIKSTDNVYIIDKSKIDKNKSKLNHINSHLATVNRQGNIIHQTLLKHNGVELLFKILTAYFVIIIILLILKNNNIIKDSHVVSYIIFAISVILLGFIFFRFLNSKNRSLYNYQNKVFKVAKK